MATTKRLIIEKGIVLSKIYKEATSAFENKEGKLVDAQPEKFIVLCASGEKISTDAGIDNALIQEYRVSREEFQNFKYLQPVECRYEFSTYGAKPISVAPLK